jgi:transcriptional antiterminator RfaH
VGGVSVTYREFGTSGRKRFGRGGKGLRESAGAFGGSLVCGCGEGIAAKVSPLEARSARWYLVHCKPRQEARALENLERQAFECFRPTRHIERVVSGRRREVVEALFPCYLFTRLDSASQNWLPIRSTRGVNRIVTFNGHPAAVADSLIEEIRRRMQGNPVREAFLNPGERVIVNAGGFSQVEAIFVSDDGDERVTLILDIIGAQHKLSFPLVSVRKL